MNMYIFATDEYIIPIIMYKTLSCNKKNND